MRIKKAVLSQNLKYKNNTLSHNVFKDSAIRFGIGEQVDPILDLDEPCSEDDSRQVILCSGLLFCPNKTAATDFKGLLAAERMISVRARNREFKPYTFRRVAVANCAASGDGNPKLTSDKNEYPRSS